MSGLTVLKTNLQEQPKAAKFTSDSDVTQVAKEHFKSTRYTLGRYASDASKILAGATALTGGLAYLGLGQKYQSIAKVYARYTPHKIAYVLLAASACFVAFTVIWDVIERKNTTKLRDALESNDADTIINAYKKSGMPPAQLLKEAAQKNSKLGMALALHTLGDEEKRKKHALAAHDFGTDAAQRYLTQSFDLEHTYLSKNLPGKIEKIDEKLYTALTSGPKIEFDADVRNLATSHFEKANASNNHRKYLRFGSYALTTLTGVLTPLAYLGYGQKFGPISQLYTKCTTRSVAIALAITFIASALLTRHLIMHENKLKNLLLTAHKPDVKAEAKLTKNIEANKSHRPIKVSDAVAAYGKNMSSEDRDLLKITLDQDPNLLFEPESIYAAFNNLKTLAALNAYGLPSSKSAKADLLAKVASTGNKTATNAIIAALDEKDRKEIIKQAFLKQTDCLELLVEVVEKSDKALFESSLKVSIKEIRAANKNLETALVRLFILAQKTLDKPEKLPAWKDAPERPKQTLLMDKIIAALESNPHYSKQEKLAIIKDDIEILGPKNPDPAQFLASTIYTKFKDDIVMQMSKASAKIAASWYT